MVGSAQPPVRVFPHRRSSVCGALAVLGLVAAVLSACADLRLPEEPPGPLNSGVPVDTPTIAPALLTPAPTHTPVPASALSDASVTPTFGLPLPDPTCEATPQWGLGDVWSNEVVRRRLGCLTGYQVGIPGAELYFEGGHMIWRPDAGRIYVLFGQPDVGSWAAFADSFQPSDPDSDPAIADPTPPSSAQVHGQPKGRFGKLWRENQWLRETLGWALVPYDGSGQALAAIPFDGVVQDFERGALLWNGEVCFVLRTDDMSWTMY